MNFNKSLLCALSILLIGCSPSPEEIPYGNAECTYCRMTVVDRQHAAELVTAKGKVYFFDAIECMANYCQEHPEETYAHLMVNDFDDPGRLIAAEEAAYLISRQLPSPMGAFLTAFAGQEAAQKALGTHGGEVYTWEGILEIAEQKTFGSFPDE